MALIEQGNISLLPSMKSLREGIVNSSKHVFGQARLCVLATKSGTEKVQEVQPCKCLTLYDRLCSLLTWLEPEPRGSMS